jgi:hypothetical protein
MGRRLDTHIVDAHRTRAAGHRRKQSCAANQQSSFRGPCADQSQLFCTVAKLRDQEFLHMFMTSSTPLVTYEFPWQFTESGGMRDIRMMEMSCGAGPRDIDVALEQTQIGKRALMWISPMSPAV